MEKRIEKELFEAVKIEDLPEEIQTLTSLIGIKNVFKLVKYTNGGYIYIPNSETVYRKARDRKIIHEFKKGDTVKELSERYELSGNMINKIIRKNGR